MERGHFASSQARVSDRNASRLLMERLRSRRPRFQHQSARLAKGDISALSLFVNLLLWQNLPLVCLRTAMNSVLLALLLIGSASAALAGPPYVTDDAESTDYGHFENYAFATGTVRRAGMEGEAGFDLNYGATPDLQLTLVLPEAYQRGPDGDTAGFGNVEIAAKYRFLHQQDFGVDVAVFPRILLASPSGAGEQHASFLLPLWLQKDWGSWSAFGGGGCELNRGGGSKDFCIAGLAITRQVLPNLQIGGEIYHQTADEVHGRGTTGLSAGVRYDLNDTYHLLGSIGPGIQNAAETDRYNWYTSLLVTF
jgi:hypothetical protein